MASPDKSIGASELTEIPTVNSDGWIEDWGEDEEEYRMICAPPRKYLAEPLHQDYGFCLCKSCKHSCLPDE